MTNIISKICYTIGQIAKDKILHYLLSYIIFDYCLSIGEYLNFNIELTFISSFVIVSFLIFWKESINKKQYNRFDRYNIIAGYIGVIAKTIPFMIQVV